MSASSLDLLRFSNGGGELSEVHDKLVMSGNATVIAAGLESAEPMDERMKALVILLGNPDLNFDIRGGHRLRAFGNAGLRLDAHARNGKPRLP